MYREKKSGPYKTHFEWSRTSSDRIWAIKSYLYLYTSFFCVFKGSSSFAIDTGLGNKPAKIKKKCNTMRVVSWRIRFFLQKRFVFLKTIPQVYIIILRLDCLDLMLLETIYLFDTLNVENEVTISLLYSLFYSLSKYDY